MKLRNLAVIVVLAAALAFLIGGCCAGLPAPDGTVTKSFSNCVGLVASKVCGFNLQDSTEAQAAINFIGTFAPIAGPLVGVKVDSATAIAVMTEVVTAAQKGGCVVLTDLQNALAFFDALTAQVQEVAPATKMLKGVSAAPPSLIHLRVKAQR